MYLFYRVVYLYINSRIYQHPHYINYQLPHHSHRRFLLIQSYSPVRLNFFEDPANKTRKQIELV